MEGGVREALPDLCCEVVDITFALGKDVDQLGATSVAECFGDLAERVEQRVLRI